MHRRERAAGAEHRAAAQKRRSRSPSSGSRGRCHSRDRSARNATAQVHASSVGGSFAEYVRARVTAPPDVVGPKLELLRSNSTETEILPRQARDSCPVPIARGGGYNPRELPGGRGGDAASQSSHPGRRASELTAWLALAARNARLHRARLSADIGSASTTPSVLGLQGDDDDCVCGGDGVRSVAARRGGLLE